MSRNRKNEPPAIFGAATKALALCLFVGGSALGYVWQQERLYKLGQQYRQLEARLEGLRRQNRIASGNLIVLCTPHQLAARVRQLGLGLESAQPGQYLRLPEPMAPPSAATAETAQPSGSDRPALAAIHP